MSNAAIDHLSRADKTLGALIRKVGPCTLKPKPRCSPYESLLESITYQQLNGKAAATIFARVKALFPGTKFPPADQLLAIDETQLRGAGLSRTKVLAMKDLAAKTVEGIVPERRILTRLSDDEIVERLTQVRGVGPWTVHMLLIFSMGRPDVLPSTDYGVQKGYQLTYGLAELPKPKDLISAGECWSPHRSTAAWYLWRALDT